MLAAQAGLEVHAGHGLNFLSAEAIAVLPQIAELNIGHFLIGDAIFQGLDASVRRMQEAIERGRLRREAVAQ
jgi:pyridoxine 5-phosphate synthase